MVINVGHSNSADAVSEAICKSKVVSTVWNVQTMHPTMLILSPVIKISAQFYPNNISLCYKILHQAVIFIIDSRGSALDEPRVRKDLMRFIQF